MTSATDQDEAENAYIIVGSFERVSDAQEYALVVLAMNLDCLITQEEDRYHLHSEKPFAEAIWQEFRLYQEEQESRPIPADTVSFGSGVDFALIWIAALLFCFKQQLEPGTFTEDYLVNSHLMTQEWEYYRSFTALFLHADLHHLLGNALMGIVFGLLVSSSYRPLLGWSLILLSGLLGNLANVWIHLPDLHRSLGASTAVFGALGLLVAAGLHEAWLARSYRQGIRAFAPLMAGIMIFSMSGIGGPETDTMAHITGMIMGLLIGLPATHLLRLSHFRPKK